jgi:hypothetical protein
MGLSNYVPQLLIEIIKGDSGICGDKILEIPR